MRVKNRSSKVSAAIGCLLILFAVGCHTSPCGTHAYRPAPAPLGSLSDPIWQNQEANAEQSDFVIYEHEFQNNAEWLNTAGEDHVKQIAARLLTGQDAKVVVERSMNSARADTEFQYPVHPNPELDMRRREILVRSLAAMGVTDAEDRVVVAPAIAQGITGNEAEAAYASGLSGGTFGGPGMTGAGGFGGFIFGGGF